MQTKQLMEGALEHLKAELKNLRTGRANPSLLDSVTVEVYGTKMRLRDVANVTSPEPRQLLVTAFDIHNLGAISKGIEKENLGVNPVIDGNVVRINIPPMDEAMRKKMVKIAWERCEQCKVSIREARRKANEEIKARKTSGVIAEDEQKRLEHETQDLTNKYCVKAEELTKAREKEILEV